MAAPFGRLRDMHEHYFEKEGRQEGRSCYYLLRNRTRIYFKETVVSRMRSILTGRSVSEWLNTVLGFGFSQIFEGQYTRCARKVRPVPVRGLSK